MPFSTPTRKSAGERRHRADVQEAITVTDALRGRTEAWVTFCGTRAAVEPMPFVVSDTNAVVLYLVTVPFDATTAAIVTKHRAKVGLRVVAAGLTLKVIAIVNPEQRDRELQLHCGEATR
jgi:hypothetical protein